MAVLVHELVLLQPHTTCQPCVAHVIVHEKVEARLRVRFGLHQVFILVNCLQEESKFIFVPGPGDPGPGSVLPRPALPAYFTADLRQLLPTAVFASNPCRIRLYTQQVVLFRSDLQNHMRRLCLIPPTSEPAGCSVTCCHCM